MARVVLTQPAPRVRTLAARLREQGHETLELPLSRIVECTHEPSVRETMERLSEFDWVILVSPAAVRVAASMQSVRWPQTTRIAVVGPGSLQAIVDCALPVDPALVVCPREAPFDGDALARLPQLDVRDGSRVLVLRGTAGSETWIARLRERGARMDVLALYRHEPLEPGADTLGTLAAWLADAGRPVFCVTQVATVQRLQAALAATGLRDAAHRCRVLAIHPRIVAVLRDAGWTDARTIEPGDRALSHALESASDS